MSRTSSRLSAPLRRVRACARARPARSGGHLRQAVAVRFEGTPLEFALRDAQVTAFAIVGVAIEVGLEPTVRHGADHGLIPIVTSDACGAGNDAAAERSLDALAFAGDAILTDISTFTGLLARPTTGGGGPQPARSPRT